MSPLPTGTVTLLFADIEGSTRLLEQLGDHYPEVLAEYRRLFSTAVKGKGGHLVDTLGDAFFAAFPRAKDALSAAIAIQRALAVHPWPAGVPVRVRMGLHTGEPLSTETGYIGVDVNRAARIGAAGHGGQILLSEATRMLIENELPAGVTLRDSGEHRLKDLTRPVHLFQLVMADLPADFPPLKLLDVRPNNLPVQLTSFIGREKETAEVERLLAGVRLLTLTGLGGCGKTRLALHAAATLLERFPHGVWLVELAALADPTLVPQTVAAVLHVREEPSRELVATLVDHLRAKQLLLVLDNCEHLMAACARLVHTLLQAGPALKILATSRERLGVPGEVRFVVPSLSVPDLSRPVIMETLTQSEAARLFFERAAVHRRGVRLTDDDVRAVARICHTLDGNALAIELAAARVTVLSVTRIAERLDDRFRLLTGGERTALPRQQTLQAMMDWSYELLAEEERALLRRLSVFAGGFTLEAVEGICAVDGVDQDGVLDLLAHLVDKSLVMVDQLDGGVRYRLLDTVRQYSRERLRESGEERKVRVRHRDWYLGLAERAEAMLALADEAWMNRLEVEHDNLRGALDWSLGDGETNTALRLGGALWRFWHVRGHWSEGRQWLETALAEAKEAPSTLRAKAMIGTAMLAQSQGDYARARTLGEESLALQRALGDKHGIAAALNILGNVAYHLSEYTSAQALHEEGLAYGREVWDIKDIAASLVNLAILADHHGDYDRAAALCRESMQWFREAGDKRGIAFAVNLLGILASDQGDYETARSFFEESLAIGRELGDKRRIAASLNSLGLVARGRGDYEIARSLCEQGLAIRQEVGDRHGVAVSLYHLGLVAWHQADRGRATTLLGDSLTMRHAMGDKVGIAEALEGLARVAQDPERGARLFGAATSLREAINAPPAPASRADHERLSATLCGALGEAAFEMALKGGSRLTMDEAIRYALADQPNLK